MNKPVEHIDFAYIILHYQAIKETIDCVESILKKNYSNNKVIVIDNGSPNKSGQILAERYEKQEKVIVIQSKTNVGFANGLNKGIFYVRDNYDCDYYVLLNNDTEIQDANWQNTIQNKYIKYHFDIIGPDIIDLTGTVHSNPVQRQVNNIKDLKRIIFKRKIRWVLNYIYVYPIWNKIRVCINSVMGREHASVPKTNHDVIDCQLQGSAMILSKQFFKKMDGLYPGTFLYFEEAILRFFADIYEMKVVYTPDICVLHKEGVATNIDSATFRKKQLFFCKESIKSCYRLLELMQIYI